MYDRHIVDKPAGESVRMRRWKQIFCIFLVFSLFFCWSGNKEISYANTLTNDSIKAKEQEIADAKKAKDELQNNLTSVQEIKNSLEKSKADLSLYIEELDASLAALETKIAELNQLIIDKENEITEKSAELEEAIEVQTAQYEAMKIRIKFMYEQGGTYYLEMIFGSEGLGDMLNTADYIEMLSEYDRNKLQEYILHSEFVALSKEALEEEKVLLDEAKAAVEAEQAVVNELLAEKENQIIAVMGDISQKEQAIEEFEADIRMQNETIAALEKAVAEERSRLAAEQARRYNGGVFAWPAPAYRRISDEYGDRIHPILNVPQFHNGIDMAAPGGSDILAAYDGKVVAASYNGSMGNYIMIDHGDSVYTIYMHASALYVAEGTEVTKGQRIAAVGSTGRSTGNHLHFSVRVGGKYVNPRTYLG